VENTRARQGIDPFFSEECQLEIIDVFLHNEMRRTNESYSDDVPIEIISKDTVRIAGTTFRLFGFGTG
jgi:hypothetical protein